MSSHSHTAIAQQRSLRFKKTGHAFAQQLTVGVRGASGCVRERQEAQEERDRYKEIEQFLKDDFENKMPEYPASYDGFVNFWVYFVGCLLLSRPMGERCASVDGQKSWGNVSNPI